MPKGRLDEARRTCRFGWRLSILCIGAHPDDIEIGATILGWIDRGVHLEVHWAVLSAYGSRTYGQRPELNLDVGSLIREEASLNSASSMSDRARIG